MTNLRKKYPPEKLKAIRKLFDKDVEDWALTQKQMELDLQCISTDRQDGTPAGPWPVDEWYKRTTGLYKRPALHEDVLTPFCNQIANQIELNPMGIEAQPLGDGADEKTAEFLEGRIRNVEYQNQASTAYVGAARNAIRCSVGAWKMETKRAGGNRQKLCIEEIQNPASIVPGFFKRAAGEDMRRCWELDRMSHEEFRSKYPRAAIKNFDSTYISEAPRWVNDTTVQIAAWWHLEEDERELLTIDAPEGQTLAYSDEFESGVKSLEGRISSRVKETRQVVLKTIINGVEALAETEWIDPGDGEAYPPEIPVILVLGPIKYERGERIIESVVRKGRNGQLRYDFIISAGQELMSLAPKTARLGPEGTFDTSTDWNPRSITSTREYKPVVEPSTGQPLPPPVLEQYDISGVQFIELAKDACMRDIQNAIGMGATERKDRTAKSGKALEALAEEMSVGHAHYFGALRLAQERGYRIMQRILPILDEGQQEVTIRDRFGKMKPMQAMYQGEHAVAVLAGKRYQTLQQKQEEFAQELLKNGSGGDPVINLVALRASAKMGGLGEKGDEFVKVIDAVINMQFPQIGKAISGEEQPIDPRAQAVIAQAQEAVRGLNAYVEKLEQQIIELQDKIDAKVVDNEGKKAISDADNATKIELERMKEAHEFAIKELELQIERLRAQTAFASTTQNNFTKENMQGRELSHSSQEAERERQHASMEGERERQSAAEQAERDRELAASTKETKD